MQQRKILMGVDCSAPIPNEDDSWGLLAEPGENEDFLSTSHCHSPSQPQNKHLIRTSGSSCH